MIAVIGTTVSSRQMDEIERQVTELETAVAEVVEEAGAVAPELPARTEETTVPEVEEKIEEPDAPEPPISEEKKSFGEKVKDFFTPEEDEEEDEALPSDEDQVFRILCIGDSVTSHPYVGIGENPAGYWLQTWGMAASAEEKDYSHVLASLYEDEYEAVTLSVCNYNNWELAEASGLPRSAALSYLDPLLEENLDLIVFQLGENCTAYQNLAADFAELIDYVRAAAPEARIAVTGTIIRMDPDRNTAVDQIKQAVTEEKGAVYVDMSGYDESMWVGEGAQIVNPEGQVTVISLNQRTHPGDYGMAWIADRIFQALH